MGKTFIFAFALSLAGAAVASAQTASPPPEDNTRFGFGFGFNAYMASDSRFSGTGNMFLLSFRLTDDFVISLMREEFRLNGSGTTAAGAKKDVDVDCSITGIRLIRRVTKFLNVGLDLGSVNYSNGLNGNSIMGGFIASFTALESRDKLVNTKLDIDLGYRFINTENADVFENPSNIVKDLSSVILGLNFKMFF
jgi:opacity protein-like surface antigen